MIQVYFEDDMSRVQVFCWNKQLKNEAECVEDELRSGRSMEVRMTTTLSVSRCYFLRLAVQKLADERNIDYKMV